MKSISYGYIAKFYSLSGMECLQFMYLRTLHWCLLPHISQIRNLSVAPIFLLYSTIIGRIQFTEVKAPLTIASISDPPLWVLLRTSISQCPTGSSLRNLVKMLYWPSELSKSRGINLSFKEIKVDCLEVLIKSEITCGRDIYLFICVNAFK